MYSDRLINDIMHLIKALSLPPLRSDEGDVTGSLQGWWPGALHTQGFRPSVFLFSQCFMTFELAQVSIDV